MADLRVVPSADASPLHRLMDDYLASCRARGLSARTIDGAYGYPLRRVFLPFCDAEGISDVEQITPRVLDRLSAKLLENDSHRGRPISKHTVHSYMRAINHFLGWAGREGEQVRAKAQLPRLPKQLVEILSREEVQAMEDAAPTERDKIIVRTLADTGIRVGELVALRPGDLHVQGRNQYLKVRGKGPRERLVPLPPALYRRLRRYADRGRPDDTNSDRLFLALRRSALGTFDALTTSGVSQLLHALAVTAGVKKRVHPHLLRHSFATWTLTRDPSVELLSTLADLYGFDLWQMMAEAGWVPEHYVDDAPAPRPTGWDLLPARPVRRPHARRGGRGGGVRQAPQAPPAATHGTDEPGRSQRPLTTGDRRPFLTRPEAGPSPVWPRHQTRASARPGSSASPPTRWRGRRRSGWRCCG
jgi:site-specific recombinase XerD